MKQIVLENRDTFKKVIEVDFFPPVYRLARFQPISVLTDPNTPAYPDEEILEFYPSGEPVNAYGVTIAHYKEK